MKQLTGVGFSSGVMKERNVQAHLKGMCDDSIRNKKVKLMVNIDDQLIRQIKDWLGVDGSNLFRGYKKKYGNPETGH